MTNVPLAPVVTPNCLKIMTTRVTRVGIIVFVAKRLYSSDMYPAVMQGGG